MSEDRPSIRPSSADGSIADRRAPSNSELMFVILTARGEIEAIKTRQTDSERRMAALESTLHDLSVGLAEALKRIDEHMVAEERNQNLFLTKINALLLAALGAAGAAALDLVVNYVNYVK